MPQEIERKFLVTGHFPEGDATEITQAYLSLDPERTIRVRIRSGEATINIKGKTKGISRLEFEYPIPLEDAESLLGLVVGAPIEKTRHCVGPWEIDVFKGVNAGLIIAEIELDSEDAPFEKPDWIGEEVSGDSRYFNAALVNEPYSKW